jgi:spermidine/putrescine-binding protein
VLTGHSGFDVVVPTTGSFAREIRSGAYLSLDKTKLPNLINLDPNGAFAERSSHKLALGIRLTTRWG